MTPHGSALWAVPPRSNSSREPCSSPLPFTRLSFYTFYTILKCHLVVHRKTSQVINEYQSLETGAVSIWLTCLTYSNWCTYWGQKLQPALKMTWSCKVNSSFQRSPLKKNEGWCYGGLLHISWLSNGSFLMQKTNKTFSLQSQWPLLPPLNTSTHKQDSTCVQHFSD